MNSAWSDMTPKTPSSAASGKNQNILAPVSLVCGLLAWTLLPIAAAFAFTGLPMSLFLPEGKAV